MRDAVELIVCTTLGETCHDIIKENSRKVGEKLVCALGILGENIMYVPQLDNDLIDSRH